MSVKNSAALFALVLFASLTTAFGEPWGADGATATAAAPLDSRSFSELGTVLYLSPDGSDGNDGLSWSTALGTLTNAIARGATDGSIVNIAAGTYPLPSTLSLTNAITLRGATGNPADVVLERPASARENYRLFNMRHRGAVLEGLTLQRGCNEATFTNGGGVYIHSEGGTITNCILRSNRTQGHHGSGSAVYCASSYGIVTHCVVSNNTTAVYDNNFGGPLFMDYGRIDNCLVTKHTETSSNYGGMIVLNNGAVAENCTVVANRAKGYAGICARSAGVRVRNCVIAANTTTSATAADAVWGGTASCFTNCFSDAHAPNAWCYAGAGLVFANAGAGDWHPTIASAAVDAGGYVANGSTLDLDGNPRFVDAVDAGCYELQKDGFLIGFVPDIAAAFVPATVTFTASVSGAAPGSALEYRWDFDNDGVVDEVTVLPSVTHTYVRAGIYSVTLTVADATSGISAATTLDNVFKANRRILYVADGNPGAAAPYDTWATASDTIQKAIDYAADGAEIVVSNGTYLLSASVNVDKEITLRSLTEHPEDVRLDGRNAVRCLTMNAGKKALVHSLVLQNGIASGIRIYGGGAYVHTAGGVISNCVVRGCRASGKSAACGGLYGGCDNALFTHCIITNNTTQTGQTDGTTVSGIAVHLVGRSRLEHSLVADNRYTGGWGASTVFVANGVVRFCTIVGNRARDFGGVNLAGDTARVAHCLIEGNTSSWTDTNACPNAVRYRVWGSETSPSYNAQSINSADAARATEARSRQITNCVADAVLVNDWCYQEPIALTLPKYLEKGDLAPGPSSKAHNAVSPAAAGAMPETDVLRQPRLHGSRYDLGAIESLHNSGLVLILR